VKSNSAFFSLLLSAALLAQQAPAPRVQPLPAASQKPIDMGAGVKFTANSDLVLIDVQVVGKDGNPIKGLKQSQFTIYEDDKVQKINSLDYFDIEHMDKLEVAENADIAPTTISLGTIDSPEKLKEQVRDHRMIVLFFDMTSLQPDDIRRASDSAQKYLKEQMTPADLVGIVMYGTSLQVVANFTNDKKLLTRVVSAIRTGKDAALAGLAANSDDTDASEDTNAAFTADETEFNIFNTDRKLAAIQDLANLLRFIPGKKNVIHYTGGISQTGEENRSQLRVATDAANKANMSLYTVDARGLAAAPPGGDATTGGSAGNSMFRGAAVFRQVDQRNTSRETLYTLASDTGGKAFFDEGDLGVVFKQVQADTSGYYLLGYTSSNARQDGKWRRIRVKVDVAGKIHFREGYYGPKDYKIYSTEDRERQLGDAMSSDNNRNELAVVVETAQFRLNGHTNEIFVPVSAKLSSSALDWAEKKGAKEAQFDFAAEFKEEKTKRVVGTLRDTIKVKLDAGRYEQVKQQALIYQGGIVLGPGNYRLKFVARENATGKIGTFEDNLILPSADGKTLALSSVMLSSQIEPVRKTKEVQLQGFARDARMGKSPLEVAGERVIPSVTRVFTSDQQLYVLFQAYAPPGSDPKLLRAGLVLFRNGVKVSETPMVEPGEIDEATRTVSFRMSVALDKMKTGRYTVQAVTLQPGGELSAFGRGFFALRPPIAPVPAAAAPTSSPSR
jgi:VWFA-related protein